MLKLLTNLLCTGLGVDPWHLVGKAPGLENGVNELSGKALIILLESLVVGSVANASHDGFNERRWAVCGSLGASTSEVPVLLIARTSTGTTTQ